MRNILVSNKNFLLTGGVGVLILAQFGITCGMFPELRIASSCNSCYFSPSPSVLRCHSWVQSIRSTPTQDQFHAWHKRHLCRVRCRHSYCTHLPFAPQPIGLPEERAHNQPPHPLHREHGYLNRLLRDFDPHFQNRIPEHVHLHGLLHVGCPQYVHCLSFGLLFLLITKELFSLLELAVCNVRENSVSSITYFCLIRPRLNTRDAIRRGGNSEPSSNGMSSVPLGRINVNQFESKVSYSNSSLVDLRLNGSSAIPPRSSIPPFPGFSTTCTLDQSRHRNQA